MPVINIQVRRKKASNPLTRIVCGNSDYLISFDFDEEWAAHDAKTARFIWNGQYADVVFTGNICAVPVITNASVCAVGVYAGDLQTTTPALIGCDKSILCGGGLPADPTPDVYAQIMALLNGGGSVPGAGVTIDPTLTQSGQAADAKAVGDAVSKLSKAKLDADKLTEAVNNALEQAKSSGEFDGADGAPGKDGKDGAPGPAGADGKTPAKGTDYFTEADKAELVDSVLAALPTWEGGSY